MVIAHIINKHNISTHYLVQMDRATSDSTWIIETTYLRSSDT